MNIGNNPLSIGAKWVSSMTMRAAGRPFRAGLYALDFLLVISSITRFAHLRSVPLGRGDVVWPKVSRKPALRSICWAHAKSQGNSCFLGEHFLMRQSLFESSHSGPPIMMRLTPEANTLPTKFGRGIFRRSLAKQTRQRKRIVNIKHHRDRQSDRADKVATTSCNPIRVCENLANLPKMVGFPENLF